MGIDGKKRRKRAHFLLANFVLGKGKKTQSDHNVASLLTALSFFS